MGRVWVKGWVMRGVNEVGIEDGTGELRSLWEGEPVGTLPLIDVEPDEFELPLAAIVVVEPPVRTLFDKGAGDLRVLLLEADSEAICCIGVIGIVRSLIEWVW